MNTVQLVSGACIGFVRDDYASHDLNAEKAGNASASVSVVSYEAIPVVSVYVGGRYLIANKIGLYAEQAVGQNYFSLSVGTVLRF